MYWLFSAIVIFNVIAKWQAFTRDWNWNWDPGFLLYNYLDEKFRNSHSFTTFLNNKGRSKLDCEFIRQNVSGFGEGVTQPALYVMVEAWSPIQEQSTISSLCYSGSLTGRKICSDYRWRGGIYTLDPKLFGWNALLWKFNDFSFNHS